MAQKKSDNFSQNAYDLDEKSKREYLGPTHPGPTHPPPVQEKYRKEYVGNVEKKLDREPIRETGSMALDIKKCFMAALLPAAMVFVWLVLMIIVIALVSGMSSGSLGNIPSLLGALIVGLLFFIIPLGLFAWSGYRAVKKYGMDSREGLVVGALTGAISGLVWGVFSLVLIVFIMPYYISSLSSGLPAGSQTASALANMQNATSGATAIVGVIINTIFVIVIGAFVGALCGVVGVVIASRK